MVLAELPAVPRVQTTLLLMLARGCEGMGVYGEVVTDTDKEDDQDCSQSQETLAFVTDSHA